MQQNIPILFEDEHLIIVDKPSGIAVLPDRFKTEVPSIVSFLKSRYPEIFVVHRLDRETSGVLCFAKNAAAHRHLSMQFQNHTMGKYYAVIVKGRVASEEGVIDSPIAENPAKLGTMILHAKGKPSMTLFKVEEYFKHYTFLKVKIETGRTHQIRVHLSGVGHPLAVDPVYKGDAGFLLSFIKKNYKQTEEEERPLMTRLTLHAYKLMLIHPVLETEISVESPLPKDLETLLKVLRKHDK